MMTATNWVPNEIAAYTGVEGDLFAEAALFADIYHCDAVAVTNATVASSDAAVR